MKSLLAVIILGAFFLSLSIQPVGAQISETLVQELNTPVEAPDFTLKEVGGSEISLKELSGKVVILNFFTTW